MDYDRNPEMIAGYFCYPADMTTKTERGVWLTPSVRDEVIDFYLWWNDLPKDQQEQEQHQTHKRAFELIEQSFSAFALTFAKDPRNLIALVANGSENTALAKFLDRPEIAKQAPLVEIFKRAIDRAYKISNKAEASMDLTYQEGLLENKENALEKAREAGIKAKEAYVTAQEDYGNKKNVVTHAKKNHDERFKEFTNAKAALEEENERYQEDIITAEKDYQKDLKSQQDVEAITLFVIQSYWKTEAQAASSSIAEANDQSLLQQKQPIDHIFKEVWKSFQNPKERFTDRKREFFAKSILPLAYSNTNRTQLKTKTLRRFNKVVKTKFNPLRDLTRYSSFNWLMQIVHLIAETCGLEKPRFWNLDEKNTMKLGLTDKKSSASSPAENSSSVKPKSTQKLFKKYALVPRIKDGTESDESDESIELDEKEHLSENEEKSTESTVEENQNDTKSESKSDNNTTPTDDAPFEPENKSDDNNTEQLEDKITSESDSGGYTVIGGPEITAEKPIEDHASTQASTITSIESSVTSTVTSMLSAEEQDDDAETDGDNSPTPTSTPTKNRSTRILKKTALNINRIYALKKQDRGASTTETSTEEITSSVDTISSETISSETISSSPRGGQG